MEPSLKFEIFKHAAFIADCQYKERRKNIEAHNDRVILTGGALRELPEFPSVGEIMGIAHKIESFVW